MFTHKVSVAPMMACTDKHYRYLARLIAPSILLYTEMITTPAILHGDKSYLLDFDASEHPLALQLGGSDPEQLAQCAKIAQAWGYGEVNLNAGCPSSRVEKGRFGACLMKEPQLVADCIAAMKSAVSIPVTLKTRIGVDEFESYEALLNLTEQARHAGCDHFIFHARKAWLKGLSPKENRSIPPLRYDVVYQLKQDFPDIGISINGGIKTNEAVAEHVTHVDGVMLGREAYSRPYWLSELASVYYNDNLLPEKAVVHAFLPYVSRQLAQGVKLRSITRHMMGLFQGLPGARAWRRGLSEMSHVQSVDVIIQALEHIQSD